jgi:hypothetical protein
VPHKVPRHARAIDAGDLPARQPVQVIETAPVPGHLMYLRDARCEVYPVYRRHAAAIATVARFMGIEVWAAAELLSRRMNRRPRLHRVV